MAIHFNDELSQLLGRIADERRNWNWLWSYINSARPSRLSADDFGSQVQRQRLANVLQRDVHLTENVQLAASHQLLPAEAFTWVLDERRQRNWILSQLPDTVRNSKIPAALTEHERLLVQLDLLNFGSLEVKRLYVEALRTNWNQHKDQDKRYEWFTKKAASERLQFAWDWLARNAPLPTAGKTSFQSYTDLLIFFDTTRPSPEQCELWLMKIKKQWSQRSYRAKIKGKSQCNVVLRNSTIQKLDQLAEKHDLKRAEVLERLIDFESKTDSHLSHITISMPK